MLIENFDVEGGRFTAGKGIHLPAQRIDLPGDLDRRASARALKKHVLDEMREPFLAFCFITRADVDPDADCNGLSGRHMLRHEPHAIIEHHFPMHVSRPREQSAQAWSLCGLSESCLACRLPAP